MGFPHLQSSGKLLVPMPVERDMGTPLSPAVCAPAQKGRVEPRHVQILLSSHPVLSSHVNWSLLFGDNHPLGGVQLILGAFSWYFVLAIPRT